MNAIERAKALFDATYDKVEDANIECSAYCLGGSFDRKKVAKDCALVTVEEILKDCIKDIAHLHYWVAVKDELIKL